MVASESESQLDEGADAPTRASSRSRLVERGEADVVPSSVRGSDILSSVISFQDFRVTISDVSLDVTDQSSWFTTWYDKRWARAVRRAVRNGRRSAR